MSEHDAPLSAQIEWAIGGILKRLATGAAQPRAGLRELVTVYHAAPEAVDTTYVGEEYGVAQLIGYFYGYDDLEERTAEVSFDGRYGAEAIAYLDAEVIRLAKAWLTSRGAQRVAAGDKHES